MAGGERRPVAQRWHRRPESLGTTPWPHRPPHCLHRYWSGTGDNRAHARALDGASHRRPEGAFDTGQDEPDGVGPTDLEAASDGVGTILEHGDSLLDPLAGCIGDKLVAVDDGLNGGARDACESRDVCAAGWPGSRHTGISPQ